MAEATGYSVLDSFRIDGQSAIVTGGGKGLGRVACLALAEAGAKIAVLDLDGETAAATAGDIVDAGGEARAWVCDVSDETRVDAVFEEVAAAFGGINILINNAGTARREQSEDLPTETWDLLLRVNQSSVFFCSRAASRPMLANGHGAIVNMASIMGVTGGGYHPNLAYHATKGAVVNMTRSLAAEWGRRGIRVNAIAPTYTETDLTLPLQENKQVRAYLEERTPMGRFAKPEEMAGAILYLASPASSAVTGILLPVDCGWLAI
jgi:NAD(P)-dependent dehydrogenase (short-subunit alcohol dehydrogenase family)